MPDHVPIAFGRALSKGDVALWLGPAWSVPAGQSQAAIGSVPWLGIWTESQDTSLASIMDKGGGAAPRLIIEVPDHVEEVLGAHYSFANVCPIFYLRGEYGSAARLKPLSRRRSRDVKIEQLGRTGQSVLVVDGYSSAEALVEPLGEIDDAAGDLRLVVVVGLAEDQARNLQASVGARLLQKLQFTSFSLVRLLEEVERLRAELPREPTLRLGQTSIPLGRFVRTESPVDQDFALVTEQDVRLPDSGENAGELLAALISGHSRPWRAFAHELEWKRALPHFERVASVLDEVRRGKTSVVCVDIPAESGSGLTTILHRMAFQAAQDGYPALLYRGSGRLNYDPLRVFLTDLYQYEGLSGADQTTPALLLFDAESVVADATSFLSELPSRLSRDGRRAVVVRGVPVLQRENDEAVEQRCAILRRTGPRVRREILSRVTSVLEPAQQEALVKWVNDTHSRLGVSVASASIEIIRRWNAATANVPLLICLYFILRDQYREVAHLGSHLMTRARQGLEAPKGEATYQLKPQEPLRGKDLQEAIRALQNGLAAGRAVEPKPSAQEVGAVLLGLSVFGSLMARVPRSVLADVSGVSSDRILGALLHLDQCELVDTSDGRIAEGGEARFAPAAFYTTRETVALRHPAYGRLVLSWLFSVAGRNDVSEFFPNDGQGHSFAQDILEIGRSYCRASGLECVLPEYPMELLKPIFGRLHPRDDHVRFADSFALLYLRLQKNRKDPSGFPGLVAWQWNNRDKLCDVLGWLDEQLVSQSPSLLHTRGITSYKSTSKALPMADVRRMYRSAEEDFHKAIELAREHGGENPSNIITSLGLLYLGWAERERNCGNESGWQDLDAKVEQTLRLGLRERNDNPFAAFGLARYLVNRIRRDTTPATPSGDSLVYDRAARDLAETMDLLAREPEAYFEDEWNELKTEAINLLGDHKIALVIDHLKKQRNDLGFALDALRILGGEVPTEPTTDEAEVRYIREASEVLQASEADATVRPCALGDLLRYALFGADPQRLQSPAFDVRHDLISRLESTLYIDRPLWLFDYAMLCCQVGAFEQAADAFARLRRGKRFFEVPRERGCFLADNPRTTKPMRVNIRIVSASDPDAKGWCRVDYPIQFRDPIPFSVRTFQSRGKNVRVGSTTTAYIAIHPAGPFAEPEPQ